MIDVLIMFSGLLAIGISICCFYFFVYPELRRPTTEYESRQLAMKAQETNRKARKELQEKDVINLHLSQEIKELKEIINKLDNELKEKE